MNTVATGSCFCGAVRAEMISDPFWICFDHDDDCRRAIGTPLTVWVGYRPGQVKFITGQPKSFSKTKGIVRSFCADCGTSISYMDEALNDELYVTIGFLDDPARFEPQAHAYWQMKLPWLHVDDNLPKFDEYSRSRGSRVGDPT